VEDDPLVSRSVAAVLKRAGMSVVALADGSDAKRHLVDHHQRYQVMVVDLNLPGANGIDILARARDLGFRGRTMVMSGRLGPEELNALKRLQVDRVLGKPFTPDEFTAALRECLG
jgi:two-component system response regulator TctD